MLYLWPSYITHTGLAINCSLTTAIRFVPQLFLLFSSPLHLFMSRQLWSRQPPLCNCWMDLHFKSDGGTEQETQTKKRKAKKTTDRKGGRLCETKEADGLNKSVWARHSDGIWKPKSGRVKGKECREHGSRGGGKIKRTDIRKENE